MVEQRGKILARSRTFRRASPPSLGCARPLVTWPPIRPTQQIYLSCSGHALTVLLSTWKEREGHVRFRPFSRKRRTVPSTRQKQDFSRVCDSARRKRRVRHEWGLLRNEKGTRGDRNRKRKQWPRTTLSHTVLSVIFERSLKKTHTRAGRECAAGTFYFRSPFC